MILKKSDKLSRDLTMNKNRKEFRKSVVWGSINFIILIALLYDVWYSCPLVTSFYQYIEYICIVLLLLNFSYHFCKAIKISFRNKNEQKQAHTTKQPVPQSGPQFSATPNNSHLAGFPNTPMNVSAISWNSNLSIPGNESFNCSLSSPSWVYHKGSTPINLRNRSSSNRSAFYQNDSSVEFIADEKSLQKYLQEYADNEKLNQTTTPPKNSSNLISSFWSHPITKTAKDMTSFLAKCQYQLSSQLPVKSVHKPGRDDINELTTNQTNTMDVWTRINVSPQELTQWKENLRMWISQTILERLVVEFKRVDDELEKQGSNDVKIGQVGIERIRKTAQMPLLTQTIPSLLTIIPFLEITTNQVYLVKRIKELAKGGCISEFKWNGGNKEWEDSLPTDAEIIMHLFAAYLDTQLMPSPNEPDVKPFTGRHYVKANEKLPALTDKSLYIQQMHEKPSHYRVIIGEKTYEMVKGCNNLFHSILFFVYHVNRIELGMLGRVNLGRAGINLLWVIDH